MAAELLFPSAVALQKELDVFFVKEFAGSRVGTKKVILDESAHARAHPVVNRIGEALLLAVHHFTWKPFFKRFLVQVFALQSLQFQMSRQCLTELDLAEMQKRAR